MCFRGTKKCCVQEIQRGPNPLATGMSRRKFQSRLGCPEENFNPENQRTKSTLKHNLKANVLVMENRLLSSNNITDNTSTFYEHKLGIIYYKQEINIEAPREGFFLIILSK